MAVHTIFNNLKYKHMHVYIVKIILNFFYTIRCNHYERKGKEKKTAYLNAYLISTTTLFLNTWYVTKTKTKPKHQISYQTNVLDSKKIQRKKRVNNSNEGLNSNPVFK